MASSIKNGEVHFTAPSNIALVKYWGKRDAQLPMNPSISFTLKNAKTDCRLSWETDKDFSLQYFFEQKREDKFEAKVKKYLLALALRYPQIATCQFVIHSSNTFPHSSGIASSASSFAALAMCLGEMLGLDLAQCSDLARRGSGSAARSIYGGVVAWGEWSEIGGRNEYASRLPEVHPVFHDFHDAILLIDGQTKAVSSSQGHALMNSNPYALKRFEVARCNCSKLYAALKSGDLPSFAAIVEEEALSLHAMMMTSTPSYILMRPQTLAAIEKIRLWRQRQSIPVCFTLDAGPNLHLLYPHEYHGQIQHFIESDLKDLLENGKWISDQIGPGPERL